MKQLKIERYDGGRREEWNEFVIKARNSTFLFNRGFMDYHSDRFRDHSLIVSDDKNNVIALLPANETEEEGKKILHSHSGLTYGGWILGPRHPEAAEMLEIFRILREYCKSNDIAALDYKPLPFIYSAMPAQEDLYALSRLGATLSQRNISVTINLKSNPGFNTQQRRNLKRSEKLDVKIVETEQVKIFHRLLTECLEERHRVRPVHNTEELNLLKSRFPEQIRIFLIYAEERAEAGVCIFNCGNVVHAQYICSTFRGRQEGLLTRLFDYLINSELFPQARYFDFGICNEDGGQYLNEGLYRQKSGMGGSGVVYDRYLLSFSD